MSRKVCFALDLADDAVLIAEYERMHAPGSVWPEVIAYIGATGVEEMEIWRTGDRMVMVAEVADDYPRVVAMPPRIAEWEALMWTFQRALPGTPKDVKWAPMARIFALSEHR